MTNSFDYLKLSQEGKRVNGQNLPKVRLALLSDAATQLLVPLLRTLFHRAGFGLEIYEGAFAGIDFDGFNPVSIQAGRNRDPELSSGNTSILVPVDNHAGRFSWADRRTHRTDLGR